MTVMVGSVIPSYPTLGLCPLVPICISLYIVLLLFNAIERREIEHEIEQKRGKP